MIDNEKNNIVIEDRKKISISGVKDAGDFNEDQVVLFTINGGCVIKGKGLKVQKIDLDEGTVIIEGYIISIIYNEKKNRENISIIKRIFR